MGGFGHVNVKARGRGVKFEHGEKDKIGIKMTLNNFFIPTSDGYNLTLAGVILFTAQTAYNSSSSDSIVGIERSKLIVDHFLNASISAGYKQADILQTLFVKNVGDQRIPQMILDACSVVDENALMITIKGFMEAKKDGNAAH